MYREGAGETQRLVPAPLPAVIPHADRNKNQTGDHRQAHPGHRIGDVHLGVVSRLLWNRDGSR
jgi:hypothetical protein